VKNLHLLAIPNTLNKLPLNAFQLALKQVNIPIKIIFLNDQANDILVLSNKLFLDLLQVFGGGFWDGGLLFGVC
jgi:hypothetical protein